MAGAHIGYEHGTKTGKACSSRSARARVDNSGSPKFKQLGGERLRSRITCGRKTIGMVAVFPRSAKIMEFRAEVRQVIEIIGDIFLLPRGLSEPQLAMIGNFRLRGLRLK